MRRSRVLAVLAAALLGFPGAAAAAGGTSTAVSTAGTGSVISPSATPSPFTPGVPQPTTPLPSATTAPLVLTAPNANVGAVTTTGAGGFSTLDSILVGIGVAALIGGIAFFIWRDSAGAARRLPHAAAAAGTAGSGSRGSKAARPKKLSAAEKRRRKRGRAPRRR